jgi:hypothetical protein
MAKNTCCICDPNLPINPNVCARHKLEGLRLARAEGVHYSEVAGRLYLQARAAKLTIACTGCTERTKDFVEVEGIGYFCPACVAAGRIPWLTSSPLPSPGADSLSK